ncbi:unnamed protein product, partial [Ixodes hexagonus]
FRTTVPIFFVIAVFYLIPVFASGPGLTGCFQHLWYISADFQLFLVALLVFTCFNGKPWVIISVFGVLSLLGCIVSCWQMYDTPYYPFPVILGDSLEAVIGTVNDVYSLPSYHAVCYFSGCVVLLLLRKYGSAKISKSVVVVMWATTAACCLTCVFMKFDWNRGTEPKGSWAKMAFAFWEKIIWSFGLSWTVFACSTGHGGLFQKLLSWNVLIPLSRLTYGVYLIHLPLLHFIYNSSRERIYYSEFNIVTLFFGVIVWCGFLSFFLFAGCEVPTATLDKLLFS